MKEHKWMVYSTAMIPGWLMLQCEFTKETGTVRDSSLKEWGEAFHAPSHPYQWMDEARVVIDEPSLSRNDDAALRQPGQKP